jgi:iron complex transport system substrate-binding protein
LKKKSCPVCPAVEANETGLFILNFNGKKYIAIYALLLIAVSMFMFGCKTEAQKSNTSGVTANTREITDDLGRRVQIPARGERAVSLAPNLTETVFAVGAGNRLVGVTAYCDYPSEAQKIQKVGDTVNPNLESIVALQPQVVLVSTASQIESFTNILDQQNIAVFVTNPQELDGVYRSISQIGEIFGEDEKAGEIIDRMKRRVADIETRTGAATDIKVFLQISKEPLFTIGKSSFMTDLIRRAGGVSVTATVDEAYPKFSKETALALQPEAVILSESEDNQEPNEVFANSPAVKNRKIFRVNADLLSRPGPRLVDGLEQIARALHPERF